MTEHKRINHLATELACAYMNGRRGATLMRTLLRGEHRIARAAIVRTARHLMHGYAMRGVQ